MVEDDKAVVKADLAIRQFEVVDGAARQAVVPIEDADTPETLAERILREEHRIYTEAVRIVLEGRYRIEDRRVLILPEKVQEKK